jgi:hypothetical protein
MGAPNDPPAGRSDTSTLSEPFPVASNQETATVPCAFDARCTSETWTSARESCTGVPKVPPSATAASAAVTGPPLARQAATVSPLDAIATSGADP